MMTSNKKLAMKKMRNLTPKLHQMMKSKTKTQLPKRVMPKLMVKPLKMKKLKKIQNLNLILMMRTKSMLKPMTKTLLLTPTSTPIPIPPLQSILTKMLNLMSLNNLSLMINLLLNLKNKKK
jgi:hypothetical protein